MLQCVFVTCFRSQSVDRAELRVVLLPALRSKMIIALLRDVHRARKSSDYISHQVIPTGHVDAHVQQVSSKLHKHTNRKQKNKHTPMLLEET